jgi:hypothetical protein
MKVIISIKTNKKNQKIFNNSLLEPINIFSKGQFNNKCNYKRKKSKMNI